MRAAERDPELPFALGALRAGEDAVIVTDVHGRATYVNEAFERLCGHAAAALLGRAPGELLQGPDTDRAAVARIHEAMAARRPITEELLNYAADGRPYWVSLRITPIVDEASGAFRFVAVAREITKMKQLEATLRAREEYLREREERFRALIENSAEVITLLDAHGTIRYESPAVERMLGYAREELVGRSAFEFIHEEDVELCRATLTRAARERDFVIAALRFRFRHRDGSWRLLEAEGRNALENAAVRGIVINSRDITQRRELEERLRQAQKLEAVGLLAGGIAHDFNNLLMVIQGNVELLLAEAAPSTRMQADLQEIRGATERATMLTRQLLAFARRQVLRPRVVDLNAAVCGLEPLLRRLIVERITLVTSLDPRAGHVHVDPGQLEQIVMNLALNARDAMPDGGRLGIETTRRVLATPDADALGLTPGAYALLVVSDTGPGLDEASRARMFEPFYTTKAAGRGTGLGLATVHGIVSQSGGQVHVESDRGRGATFLVHLPSVDPEGATPPLRTTARPRHPRGRGAWCWSWTTSRRSATSPRARSRAPATSS